MKNISTRLEQAERKAEKRIEGISGDMCKCPEAPIFTLKPEAVNPDSERWNSYFKDDPEKLDQARKEYAECQRRILPEAEYQKEVKRCTAKKGDICPICGKPVIPGKIFKVGMVMYRTPEEWKLKDDCKA